MGSMDSTQRGERELRNVQEIGAIWIYYTSRVFVFKAVPHDISCRIHNNKSQQGEYSLILL